MHSIHPEVEDLKLDFLEKKIWKNPLALKSKTEVYSEKHLFWRYCFQLSFIYKTVSQIIFPERKNTFIRFPEVDFTVIMKVSTKLSSQNKNLKKLRHGFVDEKAMITTTLTSSCHCKSLVPFCFQKKRPENAFLRLTVNYRKITQKNHLCDPKQH